MYVSIKRRSSEGCEQALCLSDRLAWRSFFAATRIMKEGPLRCSQANISGDFASNCKKFSGDGYLFSGGCSLPLHFNGFVLCADQIETSTSSPIRANPGHLTIFCARGVGNLTFPCVGWGKLNRKRQVSNDFFFGR